MCAPSHRPLPLLRSHHHLPPSSQHNQHRKCGTHRCSLPSIHVSHSSVHCLAALTCGLFPPLIAAADTLCPPHLLPHPPAMSGFFANIWPPSSTTTRPAVSSDDDESYPSSYPSSYAAHPYDDDDRMRGGSGDEDDEGLEGGVGSGGAGWGWGGKPLHLSSEQIWNTKVVHKDVQLEQDDDCDDDVQ